ncbi:hypothetical protein U4960_08490 [Altererythrobacter sp. H2]|uniref:hypothetical protein n=1 Tax=Altererythrobacter sp. H2 TaxID=3108391 RepID=UPI002B4BE598|nr:hypothetical protein [Altererythrobacter sp. H2]WRK94341.1 hypothetical protein U4960_08490 [Altererythrobacter sp. H2]
MPDSDLLPPAQRIALGYAPVGDRGAWSALLHFDVRLAGVITQAREPMLAQIRLAWWRDTLALPPEMRPRGDTLLDTLSQELRGIEDALVGMAAAWEVMLAEPPVTQEVLGEYLSQRAAAYAALHTLLCPEDQHGNGKAAAEQAARFWVLGDTLPRLSDLQERAQAGALATALPTRPEPLPRAMRPLAVLAALGRRSIGGGGIEPLSDRIDALVAMRVGMFGR